MAESVMQMFERLNSEGAKMETQLVGAVKKDASELHARTLSLFNDMMGMVTKAQAGDDQVPAGLKAMVAMMRQLTPMIEERFATIPPETIKTALRNVRVKVDELLAIPTDGEAPADDHPADPPAGSSCGEPGPAVAAGV